MLAALLTPEGIVFPGAGRERWCSRSARILPYTRGIGLFLPEGWP
jgi:hypothetical protein